VRYVPVADKPLLREVFGANLRRLRERSGLSQEALATRAGGLHRTEISLLERGEREPRLSTVVLLAQALGVKVATLLRGVDEAQVRERQRKPSSGLRKRSG
jgi:transcriptional regulator with XRE-family HTH domain